MLAKSATEAVLDDVLNDDHEDFVSEDSDSEDDDPFCPTIRLSFSDKKCMGNDFYLLQFNNEQDYNRVLYDGP
ncbi:hypothetical protein Tsubulata_007459 [Turnera subulata]|uniref:Uncharacterized protein n=1 Tax=Turnera subulata TaxID=218843 RepID=A0A9Q0JMN8_9ROSI|nr:hypothetical protein Tsubulata_007459 [Turnera subulata]